MDLRRQPTITDVARLSGVSTGTVSRVINQRPGVHPETKARVLEVVEKLGYVPMQAARELTGHADTVGILLSPGTRRYIPYFIHLFERLNEALWRDGLKLSETPVDSVGLPLEAARGYVLLGAHDHDPRIEYLRDQGLPFVLVGVYPHTFCVSPDDENGSMEATRHLLELGHTELVHVTGDVSFQAGRERLQGFRRALEAKGLSYRPEQLLDGDFTSLGAYRAVYKYWSRGGRFTGAVAASDEMAVGVMAALEDLGVRVPAEVSVVGYDDLPEVGENLTTMRQDISEIARTAVRLLKEAISGSKPYGVRSPVRLVVRKTTSQIGR
ncbi:MAG: LacI family DNA-binding transcriptional regulator [Meiothermus sp.]|nr:LacI family DNA-binding transcriptional regulator [Meiothermus sp.]